MPETGNAILEARRRARDYWDIDGLPALLAGAATLSLGVLWLPLDSHLLPRWWDVGLTLGLLAVYVFAESKRALEWLKSRITYPRTGYVAPPKAGPDAERDPYTIISITKEPKAQKLLAPEEGRASRRAFEYSDFPLLSFLLLWWLFSFNSWIASLSCLATALRFWWENKKDPPWFEIAGALIAGLLSAILTVSDRRRFCIVFIVFGASGMVKGATLLVRYLRQHPAPQA